MKRVKRHCGSLLPAHSHHIQCAVHATAVLFAAAEDPVAVGSVASPLRELVTAMLPSAPCICFVAELSYV
ncbi:hypothetical protein AHAS_Ahas01G0167000 [Arachis hypogaea]